VAKKKARTKSSGRWLQEHHGDLFVNRARAENYRSRAVYKLMELDRKYSLLKPGMTVVELGSAPGSWTQYISERLKGRGLIVATDILAMDSFENVTFVQGDFNDIDVLHKIGDVLGDKRADLVLSDMAPNLSGIVSADQARAIGLAELAHDLARNFAGPGSDFVIKLFQGEGFDNVIKALRSDYTSVTVKKPEASRDRSREVFAVARNLLLV